ncbi:nuclease-related domain-containing protein [Tigheibacillus jepli]|uniref:nuclease-related domain-containing protein n=1 Tax=Tigheibacillus jepli TaxID=3035914 RepID=UPI00387E11E3
MQIDNLIITPHAIYIIEVKNFNGTITFDTVLNQFIRDDGRKEGGFHHPITQVELQASRLERWLEENNFPIVPIIFCGYS